jgi:hypothetical protein
VPADDPNGHSSLEVEMKIPGLTAAVVVACTLGAFAQEMPKPGPEHKAMDYWVGTWATKGEMKPGSMGPGGAFTGLDECKWFEGGFAVVCHGNMKMPMGPMKGMGIINYDAAKGYTYYGIDSMGMSDMAKGTVEGDTWTWNSSSIMGGKMTNSRYSMTRKGPDSYSYKWELEGDGGAWATLMEGVSTRQKPAPKPAPAVKPAAKPTAPAAESAASPRP